MNKIRKLRVLIGAAALATAGTSAGFAIAATIAPTGVQADQLCERATVNGRTLVNVCRDPGPSFGAACVPAGVDTTGVLVCVPD